MNIAVIPAYEPDNLMIELLEQLKLLNFKIFVVNDGSGEKYSDIFQEAKKYAHVISYEKNCGKGHALKASFLFLQNQCKPDDTIVILDCDGQHKASDALKLCNFSKDSPNTLILGSRIQNSGCPLRSRFGNAFTRKIYKLTTGLNIYDTQTGMRAFSASLLPKLLKISGNGYEYEMNVLLNFAREKIPIIEIPIETIYLDKNRRSHFNTITDSWKIYKQIIKFSASSFIGFLTDYLLFSLLTIASNGTAPILCNVGARFVSAGVNFSLNRWVVFEDKEPLWKSAVQYFALATGILICNSIILYIFSEIFGINQFLAKLLTEMILFICSWLVQSKIIFKKNNVRKGGKIKNEKLLEQ